LLHPAAEIAEIRVIGNFPLAVLASHRFVSFQRGGIRRCGSTVADFTVLELNILPD
jgi:hypothetical protein